jgi:hypothetical protein
MTASHRLVPDDGGRMFLRKVDEPLPHGTSQNTVAVVETSNLTILHETETDLGGEYLNSNLLD